MASTGGQKRMTTEAHQYIREQLDCHVGRGKYSSVLVDQLADHLKQRSADIFPILNEIGGLEGAPQSYPTRTKKHARLTGKLLGGLWHKHYSQARYIPQNVQNHWGNRGRLFAFIKSVMNDDSIPYEKKGMRIAHGFVIDAYKQRGDAKQMTGEWIVFAKHKGINYYLTLGKHGDDEAICQRVQTCLTEFPELTGAIRRP